MSLDLSYKILQVAPNAGLEEVKKAFRRLAFAYHPDLHPDMPEASRRFQELNEAYIKVSRHLGNQPEASRTTPPPRRESPGATSKDRTSAKESFGKARYADRETAHSRYRRQAAYQREDLLKDLLKDPFARQVYEDIYSRVRGTGQGKPGESAEEHAKKVLRVEWGTRKLELDLSKSIRTRLQDWFRHQLDDHQTISFPRNQLLPGKTVRIQIQQGWRGPAATLEINLPPDFAPSKPIRLKGKGRKIGPWQGDLYLRIVPRDS
ncbi:molecular chaperone DnaJ [Desulfonatronum thiosulfatophilum]|uniref:Molecular chaperone DnaJ n=2 Tax=Desulfonatronum thiosulfatophilum TaxID=617002 RepID=A0A1G6CC28_9BACT|nr:molecular chaperone DnaJ [Desulfonatronum thiosulfatophilum]